MATFKVSLHTNRFFNSHMKTPRGRGAWAFENRAGDVVMWTNGTAQEAARAAKKFGAENGVSEMWWAP